MKIQIDTKDFTVAFEKMSDAVAYAEAVKAKDEKTVHVYVCLNFIEGVTNSFVPVNFSDFV